MCLGRMTEIQYYEGDNARVNDSLEDYYGYKNCSDKNYRVHSCSVYVCWEDDSSLDDYGRINPWYMYVKYMSAEWKIVERIINGIKDTEKKTSQQL